jgi:transcriptional regulator with XRE-family HTH domain
LRLGITQPSVARLEAAGDNVTLATLQRALNAMGRTLEVRAAQMPSSVDESQIREAMRLTPGERLERHDDAYAEIRAFANEVGPQASSTRPTPRPRAPRRAAGRPEDRSGPM